ncbi:MAG: DUF1638 domain-containing protein [Thermodesulfobacteriota bacterium]
MSSCLHIDFQKLEMALNKAMRHYGPVSKAVYYGACHPFIDQIVKRENGVRTAGQNCVETLLGKTAFEQHLAAGAFFLMEDWAGSWDRIMGQAFGGPPGIIKEIFTSEHAYLLGIKTPCSGDFNAGANRISEEIGLPLHWLTVCLDHLEQVLCRVIAEIQEKSHG